MRLRNLGLYPRYWRSFWPFSVPFIESWRYRVYIPYTLPGTTLPYLPYVSSLYLWRSVMIHWRDTAFQKRGIYVLLSILLHFYTSILILFFTSITSIVPSLHPKIPFPNFYHTHLSLISLSSYLIYTDLETTDRTIKLSDFTPRSTQRNSNKRNKDFLLLPNPSGSYK